MNAKRSQSRMPSRSNGLNVFAGDTLEAHDALIERAHERIHEVKDTYHGQTVSFEYRDEIVTAKFVDAVEGDYPGTYMIVLRLPSSRVCNGPCFVHMNDERFGAVVVSDGSGLVGITAKALAHRRPIAIPLDPDMLRCA